MRLREQDAPAVRDETGTVRQPADAVLKSPKEALETF
jgi:hypothetical protein